MTEDELRRMPDDERRRFEAWRARQHGRFELVAATEAVAEAVRRYERAIRDLDTIPSTPEGLERIAHMHEGFDDTEAALRETAKICLDADGSW